MSVSQMSLCAALLSLLLEPPLAPLRVSGTFGHTVAIGSVTVAIAMLLSSSSYAMAASRDKFVPSFQTYGGLNSTRNVLGVGGIMATAAATAGGSTIAVSVESSGGMAAAAAAAAAAAGGDAGTGGNDWLPWGDTAVFAYGLTVAELRTSANDGRVVHCKLTELQDPIECDTLVKKIGRPVVNVCFKRMMDIIIQCRALVHTTKGQLLPFNVHQLPFWNQVWNGIFPGTKWCGSGDMAGGYHDLGADAALDKCCRAHDHCPVKLKAFRRGHGLVNFSLYTKSHCDCDEDFRQCLMESESESASAIGNMYFNVLRVACLREVDESKHFCKSDPGTVSKECLNEDQRQVAMKFLNTENHFPLPGLHILNSNSADVATPNGNYNNDQHATINTNSNNNNGLPLDGIHI